MPVATQFAYDDVYGYLCGILPDQPECAPENRNLKQCAFDQRCDGEPEFPSPRESVYLHNVGASINLNCPLNSWTGDEVTVERFRRDVLSTGGTIALNNITDDWFVCLHTFAVAISCTKSSSLTGYWQAHARFVDVGVSQDNVW